MAEEVQHVFIHHVFFWLAEPGNATNRNALLDGLKKLSKAPTILRYHIGIPADTSRPVIDNSYHFSWCLIFANAADQESYQTEPIHLKFIEECKHLWNRVQIYDSIDAG